jgi:hypothetical protein
MKDTFRISQKIENIGFLMSILPEPIEDEKSEMIKVMATRKEYGRWLVSMTFRKK